MIFLCAVDRDAAISDPRSAIQAKEQVMDKQGAAFLSAA
jgi:hypothetical protein